MREDPFCIEIGRRHPVPQALTKDGAPSSARCNVVVIRQRPNAAGERHQRGQSLDARQVIVETPEHLRRNPFLELRIASGMLTSCSGCASGSGFKTTALTTENVTVPLVTPTASTRTMKSECAGAAHGRCRGAHRVLRSDRRWQHSPRRATSPCATTRPVDRVGASAPRFTSPRADPRGRRTSS
jgi:hypothetical protein